MNKTAEFNNFSGGMTDNIVDCPPNQYELAENFFTTKNNNLVMRSGSSRDNVEAPQINGANKRINALVPFGPDLLKQHSLDIDVIIANVMTTLKGPTGNALFAGGDSTSSVAQSIWSSHVYLTNDSLATLPQKIYRADDGLKILTAGLPAPGSDPTISAQPGAEDVSYLYRFVYRHDYTNEDGTLFSVVGPAREVAFVAHNVTPIGYPGPFTTDANTVTGSDVIQGGAVAGIGDLLLGAAITGTGIPGGSTIIQIISFDDATYRISEVATATGLITATITPTPAGGSYYTIEDIPLLTNSNGENYAIDEINVDVYRTISGGVDFFLVGSLDPGISGFQDFTSDTALVNKQPLYTNGGIFDNDPPPTCKFLHITERAAYYANILDGTESLSSEIRQSRPGLVEAVPGSFSATVADEITGISSIRNVPIVFCKNSIYRIDGIIDDTGQGQMIPVKISDKIGGAGHASIVQHVDKLYFAGSNGFYVTDGYQVLPLSASMQSTYSSIVQTAAQRSAITATFEANERRIWWGCNPDNNIDNDTVFVLDLDQPIAANQGCFTTLKGKRLDNEGNELDLNWTVSSLAYFNEKVCRASVGGYTFVHDLTLFSDERYTGTEWIQQPILYDFKSGVSSLGSPSLRKWVPLIVVNAEPTSNVTCAIQSANNKLQSFVSLKAIYEKPLIQWGDSYWGDPTLWTDTSSMIRQRRYFPAGSLWVFFKQIRLKSDFAIITSSDVRGRATVSGTNTKSIVLAGLSTFPPQCIDYYVQVLLPSGEWSDELLVTEQPAANTLTFSDPGLSAPIGTDLAWRLKGYFKGDGLKLTSYALFYDDLTPTQKGDNSSGDATT